MPSLYPGPMGGEDPKLNFSGAVGGLVGDGADRRAVDAQIGQVAAGKFTQFAQRAAVRLVAGVTGAKVLDQTGGAICKTMVGRLDVLSVCHVSLVFVFLRRSAFLFVQAFRLG